MASRTCRWYNSVRASTGFNISNQFKMERQKQQKACPSNQLYIKDDIFFTYYSPPIFWCPNHCPGNRRPQITSLWSQKFCINPRQSYSKHHRSQLCQLNSLRYFFIFSSLYLAFICMGYLKLKWKAINDGVEPPAKKRTLAQRDDMPLCKACISSNIFL